MITFTLDIYMITVFIYTIIFVYAYNLMQFSMYNPKMYFGNKIDWKYSVNQVSFIQENLLICFFQNLYKVNDLRPWDGG